MTKLNYNGQVFSNTKDLNQVLNVTNRSFKYGDGLFESIRVFEGKMPFLKLHFERLKLGMEILSLTIPKGFDVAFLKYQIEQILPHQQSNSRIRLMIFREGEGLYTPVCNQINFLIEVSELKKSYFELNKNPLTYDIFQNVRISVDILSKLKTNNSLPYILAANYKKEKGLGEVLLVNNSGRVCETMSSNIFIQTFDEQVLTPSLSEGCVAGTMRKIILEIAPKLGIKIIETTCRLAILKNAKEIFTSNAIQGIQSLKSSLSENVLAKCLQKGLNEYLKQ